ncbi:MAG TPA: hypothetical protein VIY56_18755 [Vicinamibacterales bacterium]
MVIIGFRVAKPLLERAFSATYGIEMKSIFFNEDLAIGTYRRAVGTMIPEMTKVAWSKKRDGVGAGHHQQSHLPVERHVGDVLVRRPDDKHHAGDEIGTEPSRFRA